MATIYDIAKHLGIAPSTVSRAFSKNGYCDPETRNRVLAAADKLGYVPNSAAKSLRSKKTEKVIVAVPDICNPFYFDLINGMTEELDKIGYYLVLIYTKGDIHKEIGAVQSLKERYADGLFILSHNFDESNIEPIRSCPSPVIISNPYTDGKPNNFDCVYGDVSDGIRQTTTHLIEQGHRKIAFLGYNKKMITSRSRLSGFKTAFESFNLPCPESMLYPCDYTEAAGYECVSKILASGSLPTGIVACNDMIALGAMRAILEKGLRIPEDIAITGMDNTDVGSYFSPKLTSVSLNQNEIGRQAANLLIKRINNHSAERESIRIPASIVVRESSLYSLK